MENKQNAEERRFPNKNPDLVLNLAMNRFKTQQLQIHSLDGKLGNLLGLGSALLAILAASLALGEGPISVIVWVFSGISLIAYLIMAGFFLRAYRVKAFEAGPDLGEAWDYTRKYDIEKMGWWAAESFKKSYENNKKNVDLKIRLVKRNIWLIAAQTITLVIGLIIVASN